MRFTPRFMFAVIALFAAMTLASAQVPSFRNKGYKGSISFTDHYGVFVGAETSHGYMFDSKNYLGVGFGGFVLPNDEHPVFLDFFVDYQHYFKNEKSTPMVSIKGGLNHAVNYADTFGDKYANAILLEPNVGWSWGLKSGNGLTLALGCPFYFPVGASRTDSKVLPLPKLTFTFEF